MRKNSFWRKLPIIVLTIVVLMLALPFGIFSETPAALTATTVTGNGAVSGVTWKAGYIGSHSRRAGNAWQEGELSYDGQYRVSNVIVVPEAGTTIRFWEYCNGASMSQNAFAISLWKQENGTWIIDPSGVELAANPAITNVSPDHTTLGIQYYEKSTNRMYYTYTTTKANEALRFTIFGQTATGYLAEGEGPTVYAYRATFTEGSVEGIEWFPGYIGSSAISIFGQQNVVHDTPFGNGNRYLYSMPIMVPSAGTTITITDPSTSYTVYNSAYAISTWTVGKDGLLDFLYGMPGQSGVGTYTYTTTYDNEILRFCINTFDGTTQQPSDAVVTYAINSGNVGTLTTAGYQSSNIGSVQTVTWTEGYVTSAGITNKVNSSYVYSSVITVYGKNVELSFTDSDRMYTSASGYVFGIFTDQTGMTLDTTATQITGNNTAYYVDENNMRTYTYKTVRDVTHLRITCRFENDQTILPIVYMTAPNAVDYAEELEGLNVMIMGDSLMDVCSLWASDKNAESTGTKGSYNEADRQFMMQIAAKYGWKTLNYGIGGSTISDYVTTNNPMCVRVKDMQSDFAPDLIIFEGSANDYNVKVPLGTLDSTDTKTLCGAFNVTLDYLLETYPDALIICTGVWDYGDTNYNANNGYGTRLEYFQTISALVAARQNSRVKFITSYDRSVIPYYADDDAFIKTYGMSDGDRSHPNALGMDLVTPYYEYQIATLYSAYPCKDGHAYGDWMETNAAGCESAGEERRDCADCEAFETQPIAQLGHDLVPHAAQTASCTQIGWEAYETCSRCTYTTYVEIPKTEHAYGDWAETSAAGCESAGEERRDCADCEAFETQPIAQLGHDLVPHAAQTASCTQIGWEAYETCSRCTYTTYVEIPKTDHTYGDWFQTVAPTLEAVGEERRKCQSCDHDESREISKMTQSDAISNGYNENASTDSEKKGSKTGIIVAVTLGTIAVVALASVGTVWLIRKRKNTK